ncbi:TRP1, partial [Symbiodinium sp. KB8]
GVAKLDGTNSAQRAWWAERAASIDESFVDKVQEAQTSQTKVQELLDQHLSEMDALTVAMPRADDFRLPHIKELVKTPKPNPVHEATVASPPLQAPPEAALPSFLPESLERRQRRRRGRFLGSPSPSAPSGPEAAAGSKPSLVWSEDSESETEWECEAEDQAEARQSGRFGRLSARKARARARAQPPPPAEQEAFMEEPMEPMEPVRDCELGNLWSQFGASWVEYNQCVVPSVFPQDPQGEGAATGATLEAYHHTRQSASLFDVSFKVCLEIMGMDREFVADQFLTCSLRAMRVGDVQYACILDSKGLVLDDAFVFLHEASVNILASGWHAKQLLEYLGQTYLIYVRRSGADVSFVSHKGAVLSLQGPKAQEALLLALSDGLELSTFSEKVALAPQVLEAMPYMSALSLGKSEAKATVLRVGTTGEDGFEILGPSSLLHEVAAALLQTPLVRPAGVYCLDILRMEAGLPRIGTDVASGLHSPVRAALSWTLDQGKMRSHLMFGWQKLFFQLAKGPKFRRVGLLLDGPGHSGCRLLSNPHRQPIGVVTSTAWSPHLRCRVAQAYIRPEYAKANKHVLLTVPYNLPVKKMRRKAIKHWLRAGDLRSGYRRLVAACVVPLPFVPHRYPEPARQRKATARLRSRSAEETLRGVKASAVGEEASRATPRRKSSSTGEQLREGYEHASKERQSDVSGVWSCKGPQWAKGFRVDGAGEQNLRGQRTFRFRPTAATSSMSTKPVAKGDAIELNLETMTVEQGLELIEKERVQPLLTYLRTGTFENKTNMTFMKAYSVVVQFGDQQQHSFKLYSYYKKVISDYCKNGMIELQKLAGEDLLHALAQLWEKNTILVFWMQRVFQYLDRFFTKSSTEYPDLFKAAAQAFSEHVFSKLKAKCVEALVAQVNRERDGVEIDQESHALAKTCSDLGFGALATAVRASMDEAEDCGHLYGFGDPAAKPSKLQEIVQQREKDVAAAKEKLPPEQLAEAAQAFVKEFGAPQSLVDCIGEAEKSSWSLALAAEFKRASPSKGDISPDLDAAEQALVYSHHGASILSVLTEPKWFKGTLNDLKDVRVRTQAWAAKEGRRRPACLRKDFLIDEYQVMEAVAHGADTVLLMVSILSQTRLQSLLSCCRSQGLEPLVEVVTDRELEVALRAGAKVLGVNNRNLHTLVLDKHRTEAISQELARRGVAVGTEVKLLALSGLSSAEDVAHCREIRCSGILVGEALMRAPDPGAAILAMMSPSEGAAALPVAPGAVLVKVCGVRREEDASCAVSAGANLIGVIFAKSKRQASQEEATGLVAAVRRFGERSGRLLRPTESAATAAAAALAKQAAALRSACQRPLVVGVFLDQALEEVSKTTTATDVDVVQLHGDESPDFVRELRAQLPDRWIIKVAHLPPTSSGEGASPEELEELRRKLMGYCEVCDSILLDTAVKGSNSGGTGAAFDWAVVRVVQEQWQIPVIVAGGLTDTNVAELVASVGPFGVDVASGVEDAPGIKNSEKTPRYVREAKRDVLRRLVEMLCTVGDAGPKVVKQKEGTDKNAADRLLWQSQARGVYKTDFESKLLTTSAEYYRSKVAGWTAAYSCPQFLREIQRRLEDEESRLSRYLDPSSEKEFSCNALSPKPHGAVGLMVHDPLSL